MRFSENTFCSLFHTFTANLSNAALKEFSDAPE
jgi:hypothetical protein